MSRGGAPIRLRCPGMSTISVSNIPSAFQSAQLGISRGLSGLDRDARVVANGGSVTNAANAADGSGADVDAMTGALVDSLQQRLLVEASARMLSTVDQTLGTLVDVKA
jgi:hypothetical protein